MDEIISLESQQELEEGKHPGPMTEIEFWQAKCINLESLYEQVGTSAIGIINFIFITNNCVY